VRIFRGAATPFEIADTNTFSGHALRRRLASDDEGVPVVVHHVEFDPGARTNWHRHSGPQWLLIISGRVRVQKWGEPAHDVDAGDAVAIQPGEKHWHGAAPGSRGAHYAVNVNAKTDWLEPVDERDAT
jgi:quercetin dioxygenase-like cupin family protein